MITVETRLVRRPPPRLRVKTGCQTCLKRRKKCDETRPVCSSCNRLHLSCAYRNAILVPDSTTTSESDTTSSTRSETTPDPLPLIASLSIQPEGLRTQRDWNIFHYCSTKYMRVVTSPEAPDRYRDLSFVFAVGFDKPWVIHAALAPAALHASFSSLISREDAVLYTQSALKGLRQSLLPARPATLRRDPCLTTSLFLGVFEECFPLSPRLFYLLTISQDFYGLSQGTGLVHFQAIAQILEAQFTHSEHLDLDSLSVLQLTLLDATLYHLSTRLILEEDVDSVWDSFPHKTMAKYVELPKAQETDLHSRPLILPVLGRTPPSLFVQILRLTWLSRRAPLQHSDDYERLLQCMIELDRIQRDFPVVDIEDATPSKLDCNSVHSNSEVSAKLYYLAARIFLAKVLDPEHVTAVSSQMQDLLKKGTMLLEMYDTSMPCGQFICWPLLVLGCAACFKTGPEGAGKAATDMVLRARRTRELIQETLTQLWDVSYSGHVQRTLAALEKIWKRPKILAIFPAAHCDGPNVEYDGLNALIHKDGLGAAFICAEDG